MNKSFIRWLNSAIVCALLAGLFMSLGMAQKTKDWEWAAGLFTSLFCCSFIWMLSFGIFKDPEQVRKRSITRIALLIFGFHIVAFFSIGGTKAMVEAFRVGNVAKFTETVGKTWETSLALKDFIVSLLKLNPQGFEGIATNYLVFLGFSLVTTYKILFSWGWICVITTTIGTGIWIFIMKYSQLSPKVNLIFGIVAVSLISVAIASIVKNWSEPKTA